MLMLIAYHGVAFFMICQGTYAFQEAARPSDATLPAGGGDTRQQLGWGYALASYGYLALLLGALRFLDGDFDIVLKPVMHVGLGGMAAYALRIFFGNRCM